MKIVLLLCSFLFVLVKGNLRIAGGSLAAVSDYPFVVALLTNIQNGVVTTTFQYRCAGTIINVNSILSAASCFYTNEILDSQSNWRAKAGSSSASTGGSIYFVRSINPHENFNLQTGDNDLAVLKTSAEFTYTTSVQAVNIAGAAYSFQRNQEVWAVGWGVTSSSSETFSDELQSVQMWIVDQDTCVSRYQNLGQTVTDGMVCAGWLDVGVRGQCQGDTGSPLLDASGVMVGVFSRSEGCAAIRYPGINTRVAAHVNWILQQVYSL